MAVQFPPIEPTEQPEFTAAETPGTESRSTSGVRSYRQRGSRAVDGTLRLVFDNITHDKGADILDCYEAASWIEELTLPNIIFNNTSERLRERLQTPSIGLLWYFIQGNPPSLQRVKGSGGRLVTVDVRLRAELRL